MKNIITDAKVVITTLKKDKRLELNLSYSGDKKTFMYQVDKHFPEYNPLYLNYKYEVEFPLYLVTINGLPTNRFFELIDILSEDGTIDEEELFAYIISRDISTAIPAREVVKRFKFHIYAPEVSSYKVDDFSELSSENYINTMYDFSDFERVLKWFCRKFDIEIPRMLVNEKEYEYAYNVLNLSAPNGLRLRTYLINNFYDYLYTPKIYSNGVKSRNSNLFNEKCVHLGFSGKSKQFVSDMLEPIYDIIENPKENVDTKYLDFINRCFIGFFETVRKDIRKMSSREYFIQKCKDCNSKFKDMRELKRYRLMLPGEITPVKVGTLSECISYVKENMHNEDVNKGYQFAYLHELKSSKVRRIFPLFNDTETLEKKRKMYIELTLKSIERYYGKEAADSIANGEQPALTIRKKWYCRVIANMNYCTLSFSNKKSLLVTNF